MITLIKAAIVIAETVATFCERVIRNTLVLCSDKKERVFIPLIRKYWPRWLLPNYLTAGRLVVAVLIIPWICFWDYRYNTALAVVIVVALLTDFIDGLVARALMKESMIGSLFDKVADKILMVPIGIMEFWQVDPYLVIFSITGMSVHLASAFLKFYSSNRQIVPENIYGKLTNCLYALGIVLAIWPPLLTAGRTFGWMALAFGVASLINNFRRHFNIPT